MRVWRVIGNEIGPDDNGAAFFKTKKEAVARLNEWSEDRFGHKWRGEEGSIDEVKVNNTEELIEALTDAMGYGGS